MIKFEITNIESKSKSNSYMVLFTGDMSAIAKNIGEKWLYLI